MAKELFIARDTKEPLVILGAYGVAIDGSVRREFIKLSSSGDYGADPIGDGTFRMVPSKDIVTLEERNRRLTR